MDFICVKNVIFMIPNLTKLVVLNLIRLWHFISFRKSVKFWREI